MSNRPLQTYKDVIKRYRPGRANELLNPSAPALFSGANERRLDEVGVRVAVIGPTGSGKSAFINSVAKCIGPTLPATLQSAGEEGTILLEEHVLAAGGLGLPDTRGFDFDLTDPSVHYETMAIVKGHMKVEEEIERDKETVKRLKDVLSGPIKKDIKLEDKAHGVIFAVKGNDPRLKGAYRCGLAPTFVELRKLGMAITSIVTHDDQLTEKDKPEKISAVRDITGDVNGQVFFVANYIQPINGDGEPYADHRQMQVLSAVVQAILTGELFILNELTREAARH